MNILIAGGTGNIGKALVNQLLTRNHTVFLLSRTEYPNPLNQLTSILWDGITVPELNFEVNAIINLCGENIASEPWTITRKQQLHDSRINPTKAIVNFIHQAKHKPSLFINASAVGIYGDRGFDLLTEKSENGKGYLAQLCSEWEAAASDAQCRTVLLRTGIVLDKLSGALPEALKTFALGFGGYFGSGNQGFPWIHIDDEVSAILFCIEQNSIEGPVNLVAPEVVSYKQFIQTASAIKGKIVIPAPEVALKLILGSRAEMLLSSQYIYPEKLINAGFNFHFANIKDALKDLL